MHEWLVWFNLYNAAIKWRFVYSVYFSDRKIPTSAENSPAWANTHMMWTTNSAPWRCMTNADRSYQNVIGIYRHGQRLNHGFTCCICVFNLYNPSLCNMMWYKKKFPQEFYKDALDGEMSVSIDGSDLICNSVVTISHNWIWISTCGVCKILVYPAGKMIAW